MMDANINIVISGSFRKHLSSIGKALALFQKARINVLAPLTQEAVHGNDGFVFLATDDPEQSAEALEKEFMTNIEKADFLYLANVDGYIGLSAATEVGVAIMNGIPVIAAEDRMKFSDEIPRPAHKLLKKSVFRQLPMKDISSENIVSLRLARFTPFDLSPDEKMFLQSLVDQLLEQLKRTTMKYEQSRP